MKGKKFTELRPFAEDIALAVSLPRNRRRDKHSVDVGARIDSKGGDSTGNENYTFKASFFHSNQAGESVLSYDFSHNPREDGQFDSRGYVNEQLETLAGYVGEGVHLGSTPHVRDGILTVKSGFAVNEDRIAARERA